MSLTKRLEKEIDYTKTIIGILVALIAGLITWFVNDKDANILFQIIAIILFLVFIFAIINQHKKVIILLDDLEEAND